MVNKLTTTISHGKNARNHLIEGIIAAEKAIGATLGPKGRNVVIETREGIPHITKDGVSVAKAIKFRDSALRVGSQLICEIASKTNEVVGDGTTTSTVLAKAIAVEGVNAVEAGANPMELLKGLDAGVKEAIDYLTSTSKSVNTHEEIAQVGTISANGDAYIGNIIATAVQAVGKDGVITVEEGHGYDIELEVVDGMRFNQGFVSHYFITDPVKLTAQYNRPYLLLVNKKITSLQSIIPILEEVLKSSDVRPIAIIAEDIEGDALAGLITNKMQFGKEFIAIKAPSAGGDCSVFLEDLAALTGATVVSSNTGLLLEQVKKSHLGTCEKLKVTKDHTTVLQNRRGNPRVDERLGQIAAELEEAKNPSQERNGLLARRAALSQGIAVLRVGGATDIAIRELRDRIDDALHATCAAVDSGITAGGGTALLNTAKHLSLFKETADPSLHAGLELLIKTLDAPTLRIAENAGISGKRIVSKIKASKSTTFGYDARTEKFVDMIEAGIIDPTKVVITALRDASSIAGLVMTTEAVLLFEDEEDDNMQVIHRQAPKQQVVKRRK